MAKVSWAPSSPTGPGVALCFTSVCACKQKSKEPEHAHERAGGEGGVYGKLLFKKRTHNYGYVFIHMWICRRREIPDCSPEVTEKFCNFGFDSFSEDSSLLLEQFRVAALFLFHGSTLRKNFLWIFMVFFCLLWYSQMLREVEANRPSKSIITVYSYINECHHL